MALGQTHCTLSGVSPQPTAVPAPAPCNSTLARAQMTDVVTSGPNFSGTRVVTGR